MKLDYKLSREDFIEFNWYFHWARPRKKLFRVLFHAMPFVLVLIIIIFNQFVKPQFGAKEVLLLIPALIFSWFGPKYMRWRMARALRKKVKEGGYATQLGFRQLHFGDETVRLITENSDDEVPWTKFEHWHETLPHIYLFIGRDQAILVPKHAFTKPELVEFKELLDQKIMD